MNWQIFNKSLTETNRVAVIVPKAISKLFDNSCNLDYVLPGCWKITLPFNERRKNSNNRLARTKIALEHTYPISC